MKTSILEYLEESARKYPDKTAFADEHTSCTFKELKQTARRNRNCTCETFHTEKSGACIYGEERRNHRGFHGRCLCRMLLCTDGYQTAGEQTSADPWNSGQ